MSNQTIPILYSPAHNRHAPPVVFWNGRLIPHFETPQRVESIKAHLTTTGLATLVKVQDLLSTDDIAKVHDPGMVNYLKTMSDRVEALLDDDATLYGVGNNAEEERYFYPGTFATRPPMTRMRESAAGPHGYYCFDMVSPLGKGTWTAIHYAASAANKGAQLLLDGDFKIGYVLCRPPGHHTGPDFFGGYCYLNNAAIAASALMAMGKVAIVDVDYHHGNGTQAIFWNEPRVFFGSLHADPNHQYPFYAGYADEVGGSQARGTTANYPLPPGSGEEQVIRAFDELLDKTVDFKPDAVVVSLGFDTYEHDPLGTFKVTPKGYYLMGSAFAALDLPLLLVQEGGYDVEALGELAEQFVRGVLDA